MLPGIHAMAPAPCPIGTAATAVSSAFHTSASWMARLRATLADAEPSTPTTMRRTGTRSGLVSPCRTGIITTGQWAWGAREVDTAPRMRSASPVPPSLPIATSPACLDSSMRMPVESPVSTAPVAGTRSATRASASSTTRCAPALIWLSSSAR